jgi:hypothetical protein
LGSFQITIRGLDRAAGFLRCVSGSTDFGLVAFALGDVRIDQHEAGARHRVVADFDHPSIRSGALKSAILIGLLGEAAYLLLWVGPGTKLAALGKVTNVFGERQMLGEYSIGQIEDVLELPVPGHETRRLIEHGHAVAHVLERDA